MVHNFFFKCSCKVWTCSLKHNVIQITTSISIFFLNCKALLKHFICEINCIIWILQTMHMPVRLCNNDIKRCLIDQAFSNSVKRQILTVFPAFVRFVKRFVPCFVLSNRSHSFAVYIFDRQDNCILLLWIKKTQGHRNTHVEVVLL